MNGSLVDRNIHQAVLIDAEIDGVIETEATFKLEFSNQQQQIYYVSENLSIQNLNGALDLNTLGWRIIAPHEKGLNREFFSWGSTQILEAMVIRFKLPTPVTLSITNVQIKHTQVKQWAAIPQISCQLFHQLAPACFVTNQMRYIQNQQNQAGNHQIIVQSNFSDFPAAIWLLLAVGFSVSALLLWIGVNHVSSSIVIGLFTLVGLDHQNWVADTFNSFRWSLLAIFVMLLWHYKNYFNVTKNSGKPVGLITV